MKRKDYSLGWFPDADAHNAPKNALLRADNLRLDKQGALSIRKGSSKVEGHGVLASQPILSAYTARLSGTRYRITSSDDDIYIDGSSLGIGNAGENAFGSYLGEIFYALTTAKHKYDGSSVRNWGIAMTGGTPTVARVSSQTVVISTCDSGETDPFATAGEGTFSFANDRDGNANSAAQIVPDTGTGRGAMVRDLTGTGPLDLTSYSSGDDATDEDLISFWVYVEEPELIDEFALQFDVTDSNFDEDYYEYRMRRDYQRIDPNIPTIEDILADINAPPQEIARIRDNLENNLPDESRDPIIVPGAPIFKQQWNKFQIPRGKFARMGANDDTKGWDTVEAIRFVIRAKAGGSSSAVRIDEIQLEGGTQRPVSGKVKYRYVYANNGGEYTALSEPSDPSAEILTKRNSNTVTVPVDGSRDSQVNEIHLYRRGGFLNTYYRVAIKTGVSGTGSVDIDDETSDADALVVNEPLKYNLGVPPDGIIGISEPHYDRIWVLTDTFLYPSQQRNPDTFDTLEGIRICGSDETAYWVVKAYGGLYVGTSKDIYRISGDATELPDGTINVAKQPLNIGKPPISKAFAQEGNALVYLASDGWRAFNGQNSQAIAGNTQLLYEGETRHGISPVNIDDSAARFRAAIHNGKLYAITPEGTDTTSSTVVYVYEFDTKRWRRYVYPEALTTIHTEPDGTLVAGVGIELWQLETNTVDDATDSQVDIPITIWTPQDDDDRPDVRKDGDEIRMVADTGNNAASVAIHKDGSGSAAETESVTLNGRGTYQAELTALGVFKDVQLRITCTTDAFVLYNWEIPYRGRPPLREYLENRPEKPSSRIKRFKGWTLVIDTFGGDATVTTYVDGDVVSSDTVNTDESEVHYQAFSLDPLPEGRDLWVRIEKADGFEFYNFEPAVLDEYPEETRYYENRPQAPSVNRKEFGALSVILDTNGNNVTVTPILDGVAQDGTGATTDLSFTVNTSDPVLSGSEFAAPITGHDLWAKITSSTVFRPYSVQATVIRELPKDVKYWENRPSMPCANRRRFAGGKFRVDTGGNNVTVTPVLDGVDQSTFTLNTTDLNCVEHTLDEVVGRDLWFRMEGSSTFQPYSAEPVIIEELPPQVKGTLPRSNYDHDGVKVISGIQIRACTLGSAVTFTPVLDGSESATTLSLTSGADDPDTDTLNFASPQEFTELAIKVSGDTEIYQIKPIILYTMPGPRKVWDTGYIDFGFEDLVWVREVRVKCKTPGNLTVTPYFDGTAKTAQTITVPAAKQNQVSVFTAPMGREFKGYQPRIVIAQSGGSEFFPFWVEFVFRPTGNDNRRKKAFRVKAS